MAQDASDSQKSSRASVDADAERSVLGAALIGGGPAVDDAIEAGLKTSHFGIGKLGTIWRAIEKIHESGGRIDTLTVMDRLAQDGALDAVGGASAIGQLEALLPSSAMIKSYARIVSEAAMFRAISELGHEMQAAAIARDTSSAELLSEVQETIHALGMHAGDDLGVVDRAATVERVMSRAGKPLEGTLPTGFSDLDAMLRGGLVPGLLYVVAARPGMGKSAFGHQLATQVADTGVPAALLSLEMTGDELIVREIANEARASIATWGRREEGSRAAHAAAKVADRPLFITDRAGLNIASVCSRARRLVQRDGVSLIVVDYVGLVRGGERYRGDRTNEVGEITGALKELAQNLRVPVIALSQLNRDVEKRPDKHPQLSDLRDSGSVEQDANVVIFLYREEYYRPNDCPAEKERICEVIVAKNRNGATGTVELIFDGPTTRFANIKRQ